MINKFDLPEDVLLVSFGVKKEDKEIVDKLLIKGKNSSFSVLYWGDDETYSYYDIQAPKTSKGHTMLSLAKSLNIDEDNIIAFGDEINDISMLQMATYGYLMPNERSKELSEKYNLPIIKKDRDHDGPIWHLLEKHKDLF